MKDTRARGIACVSGAAFLYAAASSPTPDAPGLIEAIILCLLGAGVLHTTPNLREPWSLPFCALLLYGLTMPLFVGMWAGHMPGDMMRDLVAFMALGVPVFLSMLYPADDIGAQKTLLITLLGIGLIFSLRFLSSPDVAANIAAGNRDLLYLANSPLVAFAAAWLLLQGCFRENKFWRAVACVALALVPVLAMAGMMQRATLVLLALVWFGFFIHAIAFKPRRAMINALGFGMVMGVIWPPVHMLVDALIHKTDLVGWNARGSEISALFTALNDHPLTALFGAGWGSLVKSPAVGDLWVRFSHSLMTSMLWKGGFIGLCLALVAMTTLIITACRRLRHKPETLAALLLALLPALFLYGNYKSLCFGFLLLGLVRLNWTKAYPQ